MPLNRYSTRSFHERLYATQLESVTLLKRKDDQKEGTVTSHKLRNCMLPDTIIEGRPSYVLRCFYSGEAVKLVTTSGCELRCTINHPILTPNGFVAAGKLKQGNQLAYNKVGINSLSKYIHNKPITIEQIFESSLKLSDSFSSSVSQSFDLHGDGKFLNGDIDIVRPDRELLSNLITNLPKSLGDNSFIRSDPSLIFVSPSSYFNTGEKRFLSASCTLMKHSKSSLFLDSRHTRPFDGFCFAGCSESNPLISQSFPNQWSVNPETFSQTQNRFTTKISLRNSFPRKHGSPSFIRWSNSGRFRNGSNSYVAGVEPIKDRYVCDSQLFTNLLRSFPGEVASDVIVEIRRFHYHGPVYDLQTNTGYYIASSKGSKVFVSNCRWSRTIKSGEPIAGEMQSKHYRQLHIPRKEMDRIGVHYFVAADRFVDKDNRIWMPEASSTITMKLFQNHYCLDCSLLDGQELHG